MAQPITIPDCARKLLEFLYPTVDWNNVMFFSGKPWWMLPGYGAITIPNPLGFCGYRIYLGDDTKFCDAATMNTLVHEGFHVQQFTGIAGGCGVGLMRPGFLKYFVCFFSTGSIYKNNPYEIEAEAQATAFTACKVDFCDCTTGKPELNPAAFDALKACNEKLIVVRPRIPKCGTWWAWILAIIVGLILAGTGFLAHLLDYLNCQYLETQSQQCAQWGEKARQQCNDWADQGYEQCNDWADEGYDQCNDWADEGYNICCDWAPCSWLCKALVWISSWVCKGTVWITNLVCKALVWISQTVCILWVTLTEMTCVVWMTVIRTILFCWWR